MKAIIYYSLSGNTERELKKRFEGDYFKLKGKIKIPKKYFFQLAYLGMFASMNKDLAYEPVDIDFDQYDEIIIGSPVWAWTITPFIKKFLKDHPFQNKKVTLLMTNLGGTGKAFKRFRKYIDASNEIVEEINIQCGDGYENATIISKNNKK
jgi:flavodoxin